MVRVEPQEAIDRGKSQAELVVLPMGIGRVDLGLLGVTPEGEPRLELLEQCDGLGPVARRHFVLGLGVEAIGCPIDGFIAGGHVCSAAGHEHREEDE